MNEEEYLEAIRKIKAGFIDKTGFITKVHPNLSNEVFTPIPKSEKSKG